MSSAPLSSLSQIKRGKNQLSSASRTCQKCLSSNHWTYECSNQRTYKYRPSRTVKLEKKSEKLSSKIEPTPLPRKGLADEILAEKSRKRNHHPSSSDSESSGSESSG